MNYLHKSNTQPLIDDNLYNDSWLLSTRVNDDVPFQESIRINDDLCKDLRGEPPLLTPCERRHLSSWSYKIYV